MEGVTLYTSIFYLNSKPSLHALPSNVLLVMLSELEEPPTNLDPGNKPHHSVLSTTAHQFLQILPPLQQWGQGCFNHPSLICFHPSYYSSSCCYGTPPYQNQPQTNLATVFPLREVAGVDGLVEVHVLFSRAELSQIEKKC